MDRLNLFEKIVNWLFTPKYNCKKRKHRWGYRLDVDGVIHLDETKVQKEKWICLDCGIHKVLFEIENEQCPVCGYYCIGKGGYGCIDKKSMYELAKNKIKNFK